MRINKIFFNLKPNRIEKRKKKIKSQFWLIRKHNLIFMDIYFVACEPKTSSQTNIDQQEMDWNVKVTANIYFSSHTKLCKFIYAFLFGFFPLNTIFLLFSPVFYILFFVATFRFHLFTFLSSFLYCKSRVKRQKKNK